MSTATKITKLIIAALPEGASEVASYEGENGVYWRYMVSFTLSIL